VNLAEMPDTSFARLTCGCRIQRLACGEHGYIRVGVTDVCERHFGYQDEVRSLDGNLLIENLEHIQTTKSHRAIAFGGLK